MSPSSHRLIASDARRLAADCGRPSLVVTSPPYPMISMWDEVFAAQNPEIASALEAQDATRAFGLMHEILDDVWRVCHDLLLDGGIICVNIGDAVRTVGETFRAFTNCARITTSLEQAGFTLLPAIVWRKPANSPTKFMGSGMLPGGAYVTLEHEMILIGRKGGLRRAKSSSERLRRRRSAIFWEERNEWYSDLWTLSGVRQGLLPHHSPAADADSGGQEAAPALRERSAAFPFELAYRLIAMHSWAGDEVMDPFAGTGTTAAAAMALGRSSIMIERDGRLASQSKRWLLQDDLAIQLRRRSTSRLTDHQAFIRQRPEPPRHRNAVYDLPVITSQETDLEIPVVDRVLQTEDEMAIVCEYREQSATAMM